MFYLHKNNVPLHVKLIVLNAWANWQLTVIELCICLAPSEAYLVNGAIAYTN